MKIRKLGLVCLLLLGAAATAQGGTKVDALAVAISHAEGFGRRGKIPTKYHNPGDLKARYGVTLQGQRRVGKGGHIVFWADVDGWAALRDQIAKMMDGRSEYYNPDMTLTQVARVYATRWRPWVKTVSRELGVSPQVTLRQYFTPEEVKMPKTAPTTPRILLNFAPRCPENEDNARGGL
jgi:hypothetical protein